MFQVAYRVIMSGNLQFALFDSLSALCCFLCSYEPMAFIVSDFNGVRIASTESLICSQAFFDQYTIWSECPFFNCSHPIDFKVE